MNRKIIFHFRFKSQPNQVQTEIHEKINSFGTRLDLTALPQNMNFSLPA